LIDILSELARHQANSTDARTGAEPGRILHELRIGRAGVFGLQPGEAYYGAVDTSPLFVVALGEAANWGAPRREIAALLPAAHAALRWCAEHGDVDGDGFVESVPHPTGLTNLGWKDSADSVIDAAGNVIVDRVALCEVQAYWYRALRTLAGLERWLGTGDGAHHDRDAEALAARFVDKFVYDTDDGPFVGLALDGDKKLLTVRTSNAGHVLWSGLLPPSIADSVATQLVGDDLFSGWGVRTVGARAAGYNPFGYHRGSVWPHDTALAMHGAARIGRVDVVSALGEGLTALDAANGGQLPELLSGIARRDMSLPVPYTAACRPQAWAAGAMLVVARALLGLEPDVPNSTLRLNPCLGDGTAVTVRDLQLGDHAVSFHVEGSRVVDIAAPRMRVIVGADAVLARSPWGRASS
jgi:glycogen debranching enzyme